MNNIQIQYNTSKNLSTRISIHAKYSTNHLPFSDWVVSHYDIAPGAKVLELGCGTGEMWARHLDLLAPGTKLTLTDFSSGMLETAKGNLPHRENISYRVVDIQDIPFPDDSFDVVIANMMLYHVPDLHRGLTEVRRVLKPGGTFYCATFGQHGINEYVAELLQDLEVHASIMDTFILQNGGAALRAHFGTVTRYDREDGLAVTDIGDFADYVYSLASLHNVEKVPRDVMLRLLESRMENGVLYVPKEYGMFICK